MAEFDRYGGGRLRDRPWHRGRRHHGNRPRPRGPARRDFDPSGRYALPDVGLAGRIRRLVGHNHFTILEELADGAPCSADFANGADTND